MHFCNSCKFLTSWVFRVFVFFRLLLFFHRVGIFWKVRACSSSSFVSSLCQLFIRLLSFITFQTFHQVVDFHHFPNFSSRCWLSSLSELFITLSTFITFRSFHQLPTLYQSAMVLTLFQAKSCSLNLMWHTFSRKSNRRSVLKNEKENDSNKTYFWQQQAEWKDIFETHNYTSPPYQQPILQCTMLLFTFECYWVDHKYE